MKKVLLGLSVNFIGLVWAENSIFQLFTKGLSLANELPDVPSYCINEHQLGKLF